VQHASWTLTYPERAVVIGPAHSIDVDGVGQTPGGLAKYFNVDVTPIRILFVVMTVFGGAGLVLYLTMWILVPQSSEPPSSLNVTAPLWSKREQLSPCPKPLLSR
jgi:phage shock protein PspC (stress-responsive transcriptional regulator)